MASESVTILIEAVDNASPVIRDVEDSLTDLFFNIPSGNLLNEFKDIFTTLDGMAGKAEDFAGKWGPVAATITTVATTSFQIGQYIGEWAVETDRWQEAMDAALVKAEELRKKLVEVEKARFGRDRAATQDIEGFEEREAAIQQHEKDVVAELNAVKRNLKARALSGPDPAVFQRDQYGAAVAESAGAAAAREETKAQLEARKLGLEAELKIAQTQAGEVEVAKRARAQEKEDNKIAAKFSEEMRKADMKREADALRANQFFNDEAARHDKKNKEEQTKRENEEMVAKQTFDEMARKQDKKNKEEQTKRENEEMVAKQTFDEMARKQDKKNKEEDAREQHRQARRALSIEDKLRRKAFEAQDIPDFQATESRLLGGSSQQPIDKIVITAAQILAVMQAEQQRLDRMNTLLQDAATAVTIIN